MVKWLSLGLVVLSGALSAATVEIKGPQLLKDVSEEVLRSLPDNYLQAISKKITVKEETFKSDALLTSDLCDLHEDVKFGSTRNLEISISSKLISLAETNEAAFNCGHGSFRNMLKAVIIHELTHVKDNKERISTDPDFQRIVGMKKVSRNSKKKLMNQNHAISPDSYEFANLEESLAVNTEYLILDPQYECRKPATANFLSKRLGIPLKGKCETNYKVLVQSAYPEDNYLSATSIDPKRIYQIHYLFAGKGRAMMSRWGHAMFRLIVCAPHRKQTGPECLKDVSHHLALSYRAYMSDINISYSKGISGGYPSQLFIFRFLEVQQEYTKYELRDLYSVPLKLNDEQKKDFLDLAIERYWTYQGKYYFIDNNCGTEALKHLQVSLMPEEEKLISSITPLKIYKDLLKHRANLADGEEFLIQSQFEELNESYQFLRKYLPSFSKKSMSSFLKKTKARDRLQDYEHIISSTRAMNPILRKQIALKISHFERFLAARFFMELPKKVMKLIDKDLSLKEEVMRMGESLKLQSMQPWEVVKARYGAPLISEIEEQYPVFVEKRKKELKSSIESQMESLQSILGKKYFEEELSEIEDLKKTKLLTSEFINEVNRIN